MSSGPLLQRPGIVGRDDVLAACEATLEQALNAAGGLLLIAGEPGIGKTTVLQAVASSAQERGCTVAWTACPEDDAVPAFWPVVRLLSDIGHAATAGAADELRGGESDAAGEHRFLLFDRVASAVRDAAAGEPLLLVLDDLHWADPSSLRLLAFLVKQIRTSRVLVVGSYRDTDVGAGHPLLGLLSEPGTSGQTLTLQGLADHDVGTLIASAGADTHDAVASRIRQHTGGNPFFVLNVARLLDAEGYLDRPDQDLPLPVGVRAVLERRLARLSQPCHQMLTAAAVVGMSFDVALLAQVIHADTHGVADLLAESDRARLTQRTADSRRHEFAHALVRATASSQLPARRREELHAGVADALALRRGNDESILAALAHHELHAGDERAATRGVDAAERAGRAAAAARAFEQAAEHFARALDHCRDPGRSVSLHLALGDALLRSGEWERSGAAFLAAAGQARDLNRSDLFAEAVLGIGSDTGGFEVQLHDRDQVARLGEALALLGDSRPDLRARLLARRSVAATNIASPEEREAWSDEAITLARASGDDRTLAYALSTWCDVKAGPEHAEARLAAAADMLAAADAAGDREAALMARRFRVVALLERGDPDVHGEIDRFVAVAEDLGQPLYRWYVPLFRGMQALLRGDLVEADRHCARAATLGSEAGSANAVMLSGTLAAALAFERGQFAHLVGEFAQALEDNPWMREMPIAIAMAPLIDVGRGHPDEALVKLRRLAAERFSHIPHDSELLSTLSGITMAILVLDDEVSAAAMYDTLLPHAGRMVVDGIAASCLDPVDYLLGRLAHVLGRDAEAVRHLEAAVEQARRLHAPLLEAHAEHALAVALGDVDPPRAQTPRQRSEATMRSAGSSPLVIFGERAVPNATAATSRARTGTFRREGAAWTVGLGGQNVQLADAKGLHDLRHLLANPATPVPAVALQHRDPGTEAAAAGRGAPVLDDQARAAYRARLHELDSDIAEAEASGDSDRAERAKTERDFFLEELSAAVGLGGRGRRMGDDTDRARKAVTMRIRNAIKRIAAAHPDLGRHLDVTVRTGTVCSYEPDDPVEWSV